MGLETKYVNASGFSIAFKPPKQEPQPRINVIDGKNSHTIPHYDLLQSGEGPVQNDGPVDPEALALELNKLAQYVEPFFYRRRRR